jgi:hypothetical protein
MGQKGSMSARRKAGEPGKNFVREPRPLACPSEITTIERRSSSTATLDLTRTHQVCPATMPITPAKALGIPPSTNSNPINAIG